MITKILLVNDDRMVREKLRRLFDQQSDLHLVCETVDVSTAAMLARLLSIEVVIVDQTMLGLDGFTVARWIITESPHVKVIVPLTRLDSRIVGVILSTVSSNYQPINCAIRELAEVVRNAVQNRPIDTPMLLDSGSKRKNRVNYLGYS